MLWSKKVRRGMMAKLLLDKKRGIQYEIIPTFIKDNYVPIQDENRSSFEKLIKKNEKRLYFQLGPNINKRKKQYNRISIINRLWERILMKKYLILNWNKLLKETKKKLLLKLFPFIIGI